jgi:hypothetical protein
VFDLVEWKARRVERAARVATRATSLAKVSVEFQEVARSRSLVE